MTETEGDGGGGGVLWLSIQSVQDEYNRKTDRGVLYCDLPPPSRNLTAEVCMKFIPYKL